MNEPQTDSRQAGQLFEEAARWFARMRGPDADASRPQFEAWLARGALHRSAYNRAAEIFALGKTLHEGGNPSSRPLGRRVLRARPALELAAATTFVLVGSFAALELWTHGSRGAERSLAQAAQFVAGRQVRTLRLADGSTVRLQPGTILEVRFTKGERRSILERGLARFEVAHAPSPFVVFAGGGSVTAHGTIFDVGLSANRQVSVRLVEGAIDVRLPSEPGAPGGGQVKRLQRGATVSFLAPAATAARDLPSDASDGDENFDNVRIADLIARANVHASRPIRLGQSEIGEERLSGRFSIDDPKLLAERIAALFDLTVDRRDPRAIILRRK